MVSNGDRELDPEQIAKADFPTAFRGFDQDEVRRYLDRLAKSVRSAFYSADGTNGISAEARVKFRSLQSQRNDLVAKVESLETELEAERGEATGQVEFDEQRATELLGQETGRVLEAARSAASDLMARAKKESQELQSTVDARLAKADAEGDRIISERQAEAEMAAFDIRERAEQTLSEITAEGEAREAAAEAQAAKVVSDAEATADSALLQASEEAQATVTKAETTRSEILGDLVKKRRSGHRQLERIRATHRQLSASLISLRSQLDKSIDELGLAESVLDSGVTDAKDVAGPQRSEVDIDLTEDSDDSHAEARVDELELASVGSNSSGGLATGFDDSGLADDGDLTHELSLEDFDEADDDVDDADGDGNTGDEESESEANSEVADDLVTDDLKETSIKTTDPKQSQASIKSEIDQSVEGSEDVRVLAKEPEPQDGLDSSATNGCGVESAVPFKGKLHPTLVARDVALTRFAPSLRRQLKRSLNDDQSDVLDRLSSRRGKLKAEYLPESSDQHKWYSGPLTTALREVAAAGARSQKGTKISAGTIDELVSRVTGVIVGRLRASAEQVLADIPEDREELAEGFRAEYRRFRNEDLPTLVDDSLRAAFSIGQYHAVAKGSKVSWMADPRFVVGENCEVNCGVGSRAKSEKFPSGHTCPPVASGCHCLVVVD